MTWLKDSVDTKKALLFWKFDLCIIMMTTITQSEIVYKRCIGFYDRNSYQKQALKNGDIFDKQQWEILNSKQKYTIDL